MKTITVELIEKQDSLAYYVFCNGHCEKVFSFKENEPVGSPYNKEVNLKNAMRVAKLLEADEVRTIIYENKIETL
jgi:hypothetical protein